MNHYSIAHWSTFDGKSGVLLFAQALEELLATHSHDSHRVPALNFHYICHEMLNVIELVEGDVMDGGNLIPLVNECKTLFCRDWVAQKLFGNDFDAVFFKKDAKGNYDRKRINVEKSKDIKEILPRLKRGVEFVVSELERNNQYYSELTCELKHRILECGEDLDKQCLVWDLTRIIASELINRGFNQSYIYDCVKMCFFDSGNVVSSVDCIDAFLRCFSFSERKYSVYLPLKSIKQKSALEEYGTFQIAENVYELFGMNDPYVLKYKCSAYDPYGAMEKALDLINFCLSVNQFIKHNKYDYTSKNAEVFDQEARETIVVKKTESTTLKEYSSDESMEVNDILDTCFALNVSQVLQLHSAAMISKNKGNQIINLWTAVELAVPVVRKDEMSRINQISNVLTAALGERYFSTLIHQLLLGIKAVNSELIERIKSVEPESDLDANLLKIITFKQYSETYDLLKVSLVQSSPLLACRMNHYKKIWATKKALKEAYKAHCDRLSQQIMRIYRTRNMLVHDGTSLSYAEYVLKNLHYYVDSFVCALNVYYKAGYNSIQTIVDAMQFKERRYLDELSIDEATTEEKMLEHIMRK